MFEHAGSGNHGCEAIVRSTCNMLGHHDFYLQTGNWEEDLAFELDKIVSPIILKEQYVDRESLKGFWMRAQSRIHPNLDYDARETLYRNKALLLKDAIALSIGGDNYCYSGIIGSMRDKLKAFKIKHIPTVLWGCSVGEEYLDEPTVADLKKYDLITVRETLTEETLYRLGIQDTVIRCADPAFTLKRQKVECYDELFRSHNVIGINVSAFMDYYDAYPNATYLNFRSLIQYILVNTDCYIMLIPHVRQDGNDDLMPSKKLCENLKSDRIICVDEKFNCMQLKDIIAKCRVFIGCRTHSTIAAYSTCVPTLVVGYSVKARGICKDIFGNYDNLLVDVRDFQNDFDLVRQFQQFWELEGEIKKHLQKVMPGYCETAYKGKDALEQL